MDNDSNGKPRPSSGPSPTPRPAPASQTSADPAPSKAGAGGAFVKASKAQAEADHQARLVQFYHKQHMDAVAGAAQGDPNAIATEKKIVGKLPEDRRQQVQAQDIQQGKASFAANDPQLKTQDAIQGGINHAMMLAALFAPVLGMMAGGEGLAGKLATAASEEAGGVASKAISSVGRRSATYTDKGVTAATGSGGLRPRKPASGKAASGARSGSSGSKDAGKKGQPTENEIKQGSKDFPKGKVEGSKQRPSKEESMKAWKDRKDARDKAATPKSQVKSKLQESVKQAKAKKKAGSK